MATKKWKYTTHPGLAMEATSMANLKERTGKTIDQWVAVIKKEGPTTDKERVQWLKTVHGFGTNYAEWMAGRAAGKRLDYEPEEYVDKMFSGPKEALRPIYDRLLEISFATGDDITVTPCSTMVPIRRNHVIAQVKPSTRTRIDFGLALRDTKVPKRLIDTGGFAKNRDADLSYQHRRLTYWGI